MSKVICKWCKKEFKAKPADIKRGWAKFCSKSCKAKEQTKRTGISGPTTDFPVFEGGLLGAINRKLYLQDIQDLQDGFYKGDA